MKLFRHASGLLASLAFVASAIAADSPGATVPAAAATTATPAPMTKAPVATTTSDAKTSYKFYFAAGANDAPAGPATKVLPDMLYDDKRGFGFEEGNPVKIVEDKNPDKSPHSAVTNDKQFFFSMKLPEGNYKVTVTLGNPEVATTNFVKAELHRLMLENVSTKPGEYVTKTFVVNVHTPKYDGGVVKMASTRESDQEYWSWDDALTLEFSGTQPSVASIAVEKVDVPTIYLIGDSTSCDQIDDPYSSWGGMITNFFKPEVAFCNLGESGQSLASTLGQKRFDKVWSQMKAGDYLFVQFGHNDQKEKPTANNPVPLDTFKADLRRVATETKKHNGTLVLVTAVSRADPKSGFAGFVEATQEVAAAEKIPLIDLNATSKTLYTAFGTETVYHKLLFAYDSSGKLDPTHHNRFGSYEISKTVLAGIQQLKLDAAKYIVDGFSFDPAHPDKVENFKVPPSTNVVADVPPGS